MVSRTFPRRILHFSYPRLLCTINLFRGFQPSNSQLSLSLNSKFVSAISMRFYSFHSVYTCLPRPILVSGCFLAFLVGISKCWQSSLGSTSESSLICLSYESIRRLPGSNGHPFPLPSPPSFCSDFPDSGDPLQVNRETASERVAVWISPSPLLSGDIFLSRKVNLAYLDLKKVRRGG